MSTLRTALGLTTEWVSPHECGWSGVTCDSAGAVTGVTLVDQPITGVLPEGVFSVLPKLQRVLVVFSTWNADFVSSIPSDLCAGNEIEELGFVNFKIFTEFPENVFECRHLTTLSISGCALFGEVPDLFSELPNLRILELYSNALNGTVPLSLAALKSLEIVELYSNKLSGELPPFASDALTVLDVRFNSLSGNLHVSTTQPSFASKPNISYIGVEFNKMTLPKQCVDVHFCYVTLSSP